MTCASLNSILRAARRPETRPAPAQALSPLRVLILEEDGAQRAQRAGWLRGAGVAEVAETANPAAALALLARAPQRFDVVISDLKMAGMDGIEFMRRAVKHNVRGFILIAALGPELRACAASVARGYGLALLGTLDKPFAPAQLRQALADLPPAEPARLAPPAACGTPPWSRRELAAALDARQFIPFFQPKLDLASKRLAGVEILARWNHPRLGMLPPAQFIDQMENLGLIGRLTDTIFRQALASARLWRAGGREIALALNVSPRTLQHVGLPERILALVDEYGMPPELVTIEMTETAIVRNPRAVLATVTRLRMHGFKISVDDFGTGYASLLQLSDIPFTELKIDRAFVTGMPHCRKTRAILESIMRLARKLRLDTVAEGIETPDESDFIKSLGCRAGQGYLFARPMSEAGFHEWAAAT